MSILTLNGGSSSLKFALYSTKDARANTKGKLTPIFSGSVERINLKDTQLVWHTKDNDKQTESLGKQDRDEAAKSLLDWLEKRPEFEKVEGVAHRVVHGGLSRTETQKVTKSLVKQLKDAADFAPEHMPLETALMQAILDKHPKLLQVACFDTSFHSSMPRVASLLPLPRRYDKKGVRKYGFHGVSYAFLLEELALELGVDAKKTGHVILAHLGNGASMCAVRNGVSVDTSMSFTPTAGLVMSTRSGDLDPGVFAFLHHTEKMSADDFAKLVNKESGLQGISETSSDIRDLLKSEKEGDERAREAVDAFCYQAKKYIGAFAAVLSGVETLVFAGGIGENSSAIRARICDGLEFLGIEIDEHLNEKGEGTISTKRGKVRVMVIPTDEETMLARELLRLKDSDKQSNDKDGDDK